MNENYLPKIATILESCNWLEQQTGKPWSLPQLLEDGLLPWFWLDYKHGLPDVLFGGSIQGYLAPVIYNGDIERLHSERREALVNMTHTYHGKLFNIDPPMRLSIDELRFKREDLKELAVNECEILKLTTVNQVTTMPVRLTESPWNIEDPKDPTPKQPWYTPARYFARQLVKDDSTLILKREILADKTSQSLAKAGIYKRGGMKPLMPSTILQAFNNIILS